MLERMGWNEEGGLGKEGQGSTDFIKPHKKKDNSGRREHYQVRGGVYSFIWMRQS